MNLNYLIVLMKKIAVMASITIGADYNYQELTKFRDSHCKYLFYSIISVTRALYCAYFTVRLHGDIILSGLSKEQVIIGIILIEELTMSEVVQF